MKKLLGLLASIFVSVGLTTGIAAAATGTIDTTGSGSDNSIVWDNEFDTDVDNDTDVDVDVDLDQDADSGDARSEDNTEGGDAESGEASNDASLEAEWTVDNTGSSSAALGGGMCGCGDDEASIGTTGSSSDNHIRFDNDYRVDVRNNTDFDFDVDIDQDADSGDAKVEDNTSGGSATSGAASNTAHVVLNGSVSN